MTAYKESGIKWLGKIPAHWEIKPLKFIFDNINEINKNLEIKQILSLVKDVGVILYEDKGDVGNKSKDDLSGYKIARKNDLVLNKMNAVIGSLGVSNYDGLVSPIYLVLRVKNQQCLIRYYSYLFQSKALQKSLRQFAYGIMEIRESIDYLEFKNMYLPLPPLEEQRKIADFLDKKLEKIDYFIAKQTKFIELLKEQKQVLINQATTKGLNKSTELKDTHIPHLGKIPTHWEITKIGKVATQITDGSHFTPDYVDDGVSFISVKDISNGFIDFSDTKFISEKEYQDMKFRCNPEQGDLLLSKIGTICSPAIVETNKPFNIFVSVALLKLNTSIINNKYLYYLCYCNFVKKQALLNTEGVGNKNWVLVKIRETIIVLPPLEEQEKIAKYLDDKCEKIDKAINNITKQISLIQEYKTSLIDTTTKGMLKELK